MANQPNYEQLRSEHAQRLPDAEGSGRNRYHTFSDGTVWFPEGCDLTKSNAALPALGGLFVVCLGGTIVGVADGASYGWAFGAGLILTTAVLGLVIRRLNGAERTARAALRVGVFLGSEVLVIRRDGEDDVIPRHAIRRFVIHNAPRGGSKSLPWIHAIVARGDSEHNMPTDLTRPALGTLQAWLDEPGATTPEA